MKTTFSTITLIVLALLLGTTVGVGMYEAAFIMPSWFSDPPQSFSLIKEHSESKASLFWIPVQILSFIALITALISNWKYGRRKKLLLYVTGLYVLVWVLSAAYFIPEILAFSKIAADDPATGEVRQHGQQWLTLSWIRHALLLTAQVIVLISISTSTEVQTQNR